MNRAKVALLVIVAAATLSACGSDDGDAQKAQAPPGSPENPLVSAPREGPDPDAPRAPASTSPSTPPAGGQQTRPNFRDLVREQSRDPEARQSPCALVTKSQAQAILGARLMDPVEAPQGPTCIYRDRSGKTFVSVAVQPQDLRALRRQMKRPRAVRVAGRTAYCGVHGAPVLYLRLRGEQVLRVQAQCQVALGFARRAAPQLGA